MASVRCPDCGVLIDLPEGTRPRDSVECPNCAGHPIRVREDAGRWSARLAYRVSCPACDEVTTLAEEVKPGDIIRCCGRTYRLTFEYGAFAAEEPSSPRPSCSGLLSLAHIVSAATSTVVLGVEGMI
jgi:hypothetical protein